VLLGISIDVSLFEDEDEDGFLILDFRSSSLFSLLSSLFSLLSSLSAESFLLSRLVVTLLYK